VRLCRIEVGLLGGEEIRSTLKEKYRVKEEVARQVASLLEGCSIKELLELA
jgi:hypothetical protein